MTSKQSDPNLFLGHQPRDCGDHRTVGTHRAWCFDDQEWCYPEIPCKGCENPKAVDELKKIQEEVKLLRSQLLGQRTTLDETNDQLTRTEQEREYFRTKIGDQHDQLRTALIEIGTILGDETLQGAHISVDALITRMTDFARLVKSELDDARRHRTQAELRSRLYREQVADLHKKVHAIETVRVWRNSDGKDFMFADDIRGALGLPARKDTDV